MYESGQQLLVFEFVYPNAKGQRYVSERLLFIALSFLSCDGEYQCANYNQHNGCTSNMTNGNKHTLSWHLNLALTSICQLGEAGQE